MNFYEFLKFALSIIKLSLLLYAATDQTGHTTIVTSQGLTIDSTPPSFGRVWLTPDTISLNTTQGLRPNWDLITDPESDTGGVHWSLGSASGHSDIIPWTSTNSTVSLSAVINVTLVDGQPLVLNVLVSTCTSDYCLMASFLILLLLLVNIVT